VMVKWIVADVTEWEPSRQYDLWHDRAAFHFLTEAADRAAYLDRMRQAIRPGGHAIIATFAIDGPDRCSGLPVMRYDATLLSAALGRAFALIGTRRQDHTTPTGGVQRFLFSVFRRE
jgi:trans-aconitate methyltransferase